MVERRKFVRIPESSSICYEVVSSTRVDSYITKDISRGGIRFLLHQFIPKNTLLRIRVNLESTLFSFEAIVKVVWIIEVPHSDKFEVGVEFVEIPQEAANHLIDYIESFLELNK